MTVLQGGIYSRSTFPNLVADPAKKDEKPGEKPTINLADLIGNNKSPITPVTYKPDEVSVEKKYLKSNQIIGCTNSTKTRFTN